MLSKLRLAFSAAQPSSSDTPTSTSTTTTTTTSKRARSSTVPLPGSANSNTHTHPPTSNSKSLPASHPPLALRVPQLHPNPLEQQPTPIAPPHSVNALLIDSPSIPSDVLFISSSPARSIRTVPSPSPSAGAGTRETRQEGSTLGTSPSNTSTSHSNTNTVYISTSPSSNTAIYTPTATPKSANFPSAPFSTPATPPRAAISNGNNSRNSPMYRTQSASNSPLSEPVKEINHPRLPVPTVHPVNTRKKTKSTATLPAWIVSSFSSSSSSKEINYSKDIPNPPRENNNNRKTSNSLRDSISNNNKDNPNTSRAMSSSNDTPDKRYIMNDNKTNMNISHKIPPIATAFPLRVDVRRGSLPNQALSPDSASSSRSRSPSMQLHVQTLQAHANSQRSSISSHSPLNSQQSSLPSSHSNSQLSSLPSSHSNSQLSSLPSSPSAPHTPIRFDRPPHNAPSPLSTASSPYQIINSSQCSSPTTETESSPAKPARRKSILGKRRNFTEVWNGSTSTSPKDGSRSHQESTTYNGINKKKGTTKWHKSRKRDNATSTTTSGSGDYSSLLAASKRVFSKSVDDLTSFTKSNLLSSPVNYSRPRKSVDERRGVVVTSVEKRGREAGNMMYNIPPIERHSPAGFSYAAMSAGIERENGDAEEELEGLSSGSSASLAHSPIPSEASTSSMQSLSSSQTNKPRPPYSQSPQYQIFKVPKLPSIPTSIRNQDGKKYSNKTHRKMTSSAQVQLPPSISLPGGLCIESTASILASSMNAGPELPIKSSHSSSSSSSFPSSQLASGTKSKSMDSRSVKSENLLSTGTSPGLAPAFDISPTLPKSAPPIPTTSSGSVHSPASTPSSTTSSFPMRPPLTARKSSGQASICSAQSGSTARFPSFGSPKASPAALPSSPQINHQVVHSNTTCRRSSQIILIEGLLQRKTDHRSHVKASSWTFPFSTSSSSSSSSSLFGSSFIPNSSKSPQDSPSGSSAKQRPSLASTRRISETNIREIDLSKGWKPFYAVLKGTNLYLHKIPNDMNWQAKSCFSNYTGSKIQSSGSLSSSTSSSRILSTFAPSTPLQSKFDIDEDRLKASISNQSKAAYLLPVANSTLRVTSSASKGDVFELLTEEGEVAVLQAASKEEADKWRQLLSNTGVNIANKRASYLEAIGKLDLGDTLRQRGLQPDSIPERNSESHDSLGVSGSSGSPKVFGIPLERLVAREGGKIPNIAEFLFSEVENRGLLETGIYRVPGENRVMQLMQAKLNAGEALDSQANPAFSDPHNLASLTKLWLRELPEIISPNLYSAFIEANNVEGYEERLCALRDLVWRLPATSFHLLDRLCEHLHLIAEHELENQMHAPNLAIVFAPTILRPPEGSDSYALLMSNLGKAAKLVASLIVQHDWIFSGQEVEEEMEVNGQTVKTVEVMSNEDIDEISGEAPSICAVLKDNPEVPPPVDAVRLTTDAGNLDTQVEVTAK